MPRVVKERRAVDWLRCVGFDFLFDGLSCRIFGNV